MDIFADIAVLDDCRGIDRSLAVELISNRLEVRPRRPDVKLRTVEREGVNRFVVLEPLEEPARLVRVVAVLEVRLEELKGVGGSRSR